MAERVETQIEEPQEWVRPAPVIDTQFSVVSAFEPTGDQPTAIEKLSRGIQEGFRHQTLLGVTGSGKTYTMAKVIERVQKPTLVLAHNKTLAAQLYSEFKEFFPNNAVEYFVSYYDYYQPEAYIARTDTYIEKESEVNEEIDRLRHAATRSLFERRDVVIVASVSCIYGIGAPEEYGKTVVSFRKGGSIRRERVLRHLVDVQYERNDATLVRGTFRVRGDTLEVFPAYEEIALRIELWGDEVERIVSVDPLTGEVLGEHNAVDIYPAKHFVTARRSCRRQCGTSRRRCRRRSNSSRSRGNCSKRSASSSVRCTISKCSPRSAIARASRTTAATSRGAARAISRGRSSIISRTITC